jgi:hypothetical protein
VERQFLRNLGPSKLRSSGARSLNTLLDKPRGRPRSQVERCWLLRAVVTDALLFGDPDSEQGLARALDLITRLRESERWSAESCAELREHLCGCGALPAGA